jgi:primosomal protein N' (replication factor Y) (superfamily II helicase)
VTDAPAATEGVSHPVARVVVDIALAHLDRPFDYAVPADLDEQAVPGCRVKVRFAGKQLGGFLLERAEVSEREGTLAPLLKVVSAEPVLRPEIASLAERVARRYAGTRADVLRLAVPPRHARVEREAAPPAAGADGTRPSTAVGPWAAYPAGPTFLQRLRNRAAPRAAWTAPPGEDWGLALAAAAAAALASGQGALACLPDGRDVARVAQACAGWPGLPAPLVLTADLGPAARYRAFLAIARGHARWVLGTRAAMFAPVRELGLVAIWDDGDDLYAEPRAPYPHAREVLAMRAEQERCGVLLGGFARTAEVQALVDAGWAQPLAAPRPLVRRSAPRIQVTGDDDRELARDPASGAARLPRVAFDAVNDGLRRGPVLVQVPRAGYLPALACQRCRQPARCDHCHGPLAIGRSGQPPQCGWCGRLAPGWTCCHCGGTRLRAPVVGSTRTAEELGRALPGVPVRSSAAEAGLAQVPGKPALVVSTPGAEPVAVGGYAAGLILDAWITLSRLDLRTAEEALRRWLNAAALVRPGAEGGRVVVVGDAAAPVLQALLRWDPAGFAARELAERRAAGLPPGAELVTVNGTAAAVGRFLEEVRLPADAELLGPAPVRADEVRAVLRAPRPGGEALVRAVREAQGVRSARKLLPVRVQVDPQTLR